MLLEIPCIFANLFSFFFNHKNAQPLFFLHLSTSGTANNIKIICSIRFSLLITIDRFYKLFFAEGAFVNRRPEMISPLFFIPPDPYPARFARHLPPWGRLTIRDMLFFHLFSCPPGCFCFLPSHSPVFPCARKISRCARNDDTGEETL